MFIYKSPTKDIFIDRFEKSKKILKTILKTDSVIKDPDDWILWTQLFLSVMNSLPFKKNK